MLSGNTLVLSYSTMSAVVEQAQLSKNTALQAAAGLQGSVQQFPVINHPCKFTKFVLHKGNTICSWWNS